MNGIKSEILSGNTTTCTNVNFHFPACIEATEAAVGANVSKQVLAEILEDTIEGNKSSCVALRDVYQGSTGSQVSDSCDEASDLLVEFLGLPNVNGGASIGILHHQVKGQSNSQVCQNVNFTTPTCIEAMKAVNKAGAGGAYGPAIIEDVYEGNRSSCQQILNAF